MSFPGLFGLRSFPFSCPGQTSLNAAAGAGFTWGAEKLGTCSSKNRASSAKGSSLTAAGAAAAAASSMSLRPGTETWKRHTISQKSFTVGSLHCNTRQLSVIQEV